MIERVAGKRIVFLNWRDLSHPKAGGAEEYCQQLAERFAAAGATVDLVTSAHTGAPAHELVRGVRVHRAGGTFGVYPMALRWLLRRRRRIDAVVDCQNGIPFFAPLAVGPRVPVVCVIHHVHQEQFGLYFSPLAAFVGRLLESRGSRIVYGRRPIAAVSPSTRWGVRKRLRLRGPIHVVPNGIVQRSIEIRDRAPEPRIVHVGRLVPHKRVGLLLQAVAEARRTEPRLRLDIVGDGEERERLELEARQLGLEDVVTFHGRAPHEVKERVVSQAWLSATTSIAEGWGLTVIESAAHGVPALGFDVVGLRDSIRHDETGWLVPEGGDYARALLDALESVRHEDGSAAYRGRAKAWAAGFTWESSADRLAAILAVEGDRLELGAGHRDRRWANDVGTLVDLDDDDADHASLAANLRRTDRLTRTATGVALLLLGADELNARTALQRLGVTAERGRYRVARPMDMLAAHNSEHVSLAPMEPDAH